MNRWQLFKNSSYFCYAGSAFFAMLSYGMSYIVMTWMVLKYHNGGIGPVAILMFCFWLPSVFLSSFAGVIVDRVSRRKLFIFTSWSRGLLLLVLGLIEWKYHSLMAIYIISILEGVVSCFVLPAVTALMREIVPSEQLLMANSTIDMVYESGSVIGMAIAGFAIAAFSNEGSLIFDGLLFFIATAFAYGIKTQYQGRIESIAPVHQKSILREFRAGLFYIMRSKGIAVVYFLELVVMVVYMITPVLMAPFATQYLHASVAEFGYIEAALSIGVILGNIVAPNLVYRYGLLKILVLFNVILAVSFILFAINRNLWYAGLLNFLMGVGFASWALIMTRAQELTALDFQGRVQSSFSALSGVVILAVYSLLYFDAVHVRLNMLYYLEVVFIAIGLGLIFSFRKLFK